MADERKTHDERGMLDPRRLDPTVAMVRELGLADDDVEEIIDLFEALRRWHQMSEAHSEASRKFMKLGENDMRAIRFLMVARRENRIVTSTMLAEHLGITGPSVTKLLDRLEHGGHIRRQPHPTDRRALSIVVTDETRASASATVGRDHARRFEIAARMTGEERRATTRFLRAMADLPVLDHAQALTPAEPTAG
ncbi:MarR family winged helix-turn-helix transcriptional regulator [Agrococcus carbonis]|uniref:MarR family winged helix-turn-helix transcriptional regulator n=1 Tax=Agrococcus carbonis TaxID=684552 RepID=UPI0022B262B4|nr:MarR family transcriptional regulator [Agrococcus carbonis]